MSAYPLCPAVSPPNGRYAPPAKKSFGSVVGRPASSTILPGGSRSPRACALATLIPDSAVVAKSMMTGASPPAGNPMQNGLVSSSRSRPPNGAARGPVTAKPLVQTIEISPSAAAISA